MKQLLKYISKVNYAHSKTKSLKAGFPKEIGEILNVEAGEMIIWNVKLYKDNIIIVVEKEEKEE